MFKLDPTFALENYEHASRLNENIKKIYELLGPLNFDIQPPPSFPSFYEEEEIQKHLDQIQNRRDFQMYFEKRKSGAQYRGQVIAANARPDGKGFKVFKGQNSIYEGWFENGLCNGYGRAISSKGEVYQGFFQEDTMHGEGFFYWPDGRIYEGNWESNKKNGKGKYFWPNGQIYDGMFKEDNCSGFGILYYPDGKRFEGYWKEGEKHGAGTYIYPNTANFQVVYRNGQKQSSGKLIDPTGRELDVSKKEMKYRHRSLSKKSEDNARYIELGKFE